MKEKKIQVLDLVTNPVDVNQVDSISGKELAGRASLGELDGATIVLLPTSASIVIAAAESKSSFMHILPGLSGDNENHQLYWLRLNTIYSSQDNAQKENGSAKHSGQTRISSWRREQPSRNNNRQLLPRRESREHSTNNGMTENQRRYLFRLLAERDVKSTKAKDYLLDYFEVDSIKKIPKDEASVLIDSLVNGGDEE